MTARLPFARHAAPLLAAVVVAAAASAAPVPKEIRRVTDDQLVVGSWETVDTNIPRNKGVVQTFAADGTVTITYPGGGSTTGTYKLDPTTRPKSFTWTQGNSSVGHHGVYELDGDSLKMVTVTASTPLPAEVAPGEAGHYESNVRMKAK